MLEIWTITIPELTGETPRRAYCYVPDSWQEDPSLRYPVLYMFDGHNLFLDDHATYGKSWGLGAYLEENQVPLMVAAVECNHSPDGGRLREYCPISCELPGFGHVKGKGKVTMDWLVEQFKPFIDREFPTLPDREHTFIGGSSMGGLMSLYAVLRYNKVFSRCAALSPSVWFGGEKMEKMLRGGRIRQDTVIYMDYGARELGSHPGMAARFGQVAGLLLERKVDLTARIVPGGSHNEASWEKQIPFFVPTLLYGLE